jgi:hypothetical protein
MSANCFLNLYRHIQKSVVYLSQIQVKYSHSQIALHFSCFKGLICLLDPHGKILRYTTKQQY